MPLSLGIVIPTWRRERALVETVEGLLRLDDAGDEIVLVDQTERHEPATERALHELEQRGRVRRVRSSIASIPHAMNVGLAECRAELVLFVDDDVEPLPGLAAAHRRAQAEAGAGTLIAGRVWQPWHAAGVAGSALADFDFTQGDTRPLAEFMGGNFSLRRAEALAVGGFDENFVGAAYRFEREFAERWRASGRWIRYEPSAELRHLKLPSGGTREHGEHLRTASPGHAVGEYYYLLRSTEVRGRGRRIARRWLRAAVTRHHLRRPWWIPLTLLAETRGLLWALRLARGGPRLVAATDVAGSSDP